MKRIKKKCSRQKLGLNGLEVFMISGALTVMLRQLDEDLAEASDPSEKDELLEIRSQLGPLQSRFHRASEGYNLFVE